MTALIDVSDINPGRLLAELFNNAQQDSQAETEYKVAETMGKARTQLMLDKTNFSDRGAFFETIRGRTLRINITGHKINPFRYDQLHGQGSVQAIVDAIRAGPGG